MTTKIATSTSASTLTSKTEVEMRENGQRFLDEVERSAQDFMWACPHGTTVEDLAEVVGPVLARLVMSVKR